MDLNIDTILDDGSTGLRPNVTNFRENACERNSKRKVTILIIIKVICEAFFKLKYLTTNIDRYTVKLAVVSYNKRDIHKK